MKNKKILLILILTYLITPIANTNAMINNLLIRDKLNTKNIGGAFHNKLINNNFNKNKYNSKKNQNNIILPNKIQKLPNKIQKPNVKSKDIEELKKEIAKMRETLKEQLSKAEKIDNKKNQSNIILPNKIQKPNVNSKDIEELKKEIAKMHNTIKEITEYFTSKLNKLNLDSEEIKIKFQNLISLKDIISFDQTILHLTKAIKSTNLKVNSKIRINKENKQKLSQYLEILKDSLKNIDFILIISFKMLNKNNYINNYNNKSKFIKYDTDTLIKLIKDRLAKAMKKPKPDMIYNKTLKLLHKYLPILEKQNEVNYTIKNFNNKINELYKKNRDILLTESSAKQSNSFKRYIDFLRKGIIKLANIDENLSKLKQKDIEIKNLNHKTIYLKTLFLKFLDWPKSKETKYIKEKIKTIKTLDVYMLQTLNDINMKKINDNVKQQLSQAYKENNENYSQNILYKNKVNYILNNLKKHEKMNKKNKEIDDIVKKASEEINITLKEIDKNKFPYYLRNKSYIKALGEQKKKLNQLHSFNEKLKNFENKDKKIKELKDKINDLKEILKIKILQINIYPEISKMRNLNKRFETEKTLNIMDERKKAENFYKNYKNLYNLGEYLDDLQQYKNGKKKNILNNYNEKFINELKIIEKLMKTLLNLIFPNK